MKSSKGLAITLGATALMVITSSYAAPDDAGWYVGANAGYSKAKIDDPRITSNLLSEGFTVTALNDDDHHFGYKLFGGYQFNKYFAVEGGYFDLGRFGFTADTQPPGALTGNLKLSGVNLDAVGILPITEQFAVFGRVGYDYAYTRDTFAGSGAVVVRDSEHSEHSSNYKFGFGLQYAVTRSFGLRLEAERYRINDAVGNKGDIDLYSMGFLYRFRSRVPERVLSDSSPMPTASLPQPTLVVVPAAAQTERYCSILDIQFEIKNDDIERQEKEKLAVLGTFMTKYPATTAVIEGHTDNVGSDADNTRLSQRRADSVVSYLVDTLHIARSRLNAVGYGETRPVANNATEEGKRLNRRINAVVACANDVEGLTVQPARITMALQIEFERNMDTVGPQYHDELKNVANFLKANPFVSATVEGHTGNVQATALLAMQISQRRAQSVVNYLVENFDINRSRLHAEGFGDKRRFAYNTSQEGQQENRRVNVIINYPRM